MPLSPRAEVEPLDVELLRNWPLPVDPNGDKHSRGTVLVVAGSASTPGAAILAGMAALRMGAGRLQIATEASIATSVGIAVPESKVIPLAEPRDRTTEQPREIHDALAQADCILIGPGLRSDSDTEALVVAAFQAVSDTAVLVLDACAIASVRDIEPAVRDRLTGRLVLTPNRQELDDLLDGRRDHTETSDDLPTVARAMQAAREFDAVVASFGVVCTSTGRCWQAAAGHPALGTSGSGDVRAGLVAGVAARSGDPAQAGCWGTLMHSLAGQHLGNRHGQLGFLAREIIDAVVSVVPS